MFGALKRGFRSMAGLILVRNVVSELLPKRTLAASRGFLAAARLSCLPRDATQSAVMPRQVVCPYVRPSVTLRYRDHIGWKSSKIITELVSLECSLSTDHNITEHPEILSGIGEGYRKKRISAYKISNNWSCGNCG